MLPFTKMLRILLLKKRLSIKKWKFKGKFKKNRFKRNQTQLKSRNTLKFKNKLSSMCKYRCQSLSKKSNMEWQRWMFRFRLMLSMNKQLLRLRQSNSQS